MTKSGASHSLMLGSIHLWADQRLGCHLVPAVLLTDTPAMQALATLGPFPVTYSVGNLADNYIPYKDAANTQKNILRGESP